MANPIPMLKFQAFDSSGDPLSGGKLYTYDAGTTTPKTTYTDSTLGTPNTNPVILDSRGEANVWLSGGYKFVLKDSADATIYTVDNITDALTNITISGTMTISSTAVTWSGNPTHSGNHTFSGNLTVQGNTTLGNAGTDTVTTSGNVTMSAPTSGTALSVAGVTGASRIALWNGSYHELQLGGVTFAYIGDRAGVIGSGSGLAIRAESATYFSIGTTEKLRIQSEYIKQATTVVASLTSAATAGAGARAFVTDANSTTFASVVAGGGANGVPVYCDGTNWRIG